MNKSHSEIEKSRSRTRSRSISNGKSENCSVKISNFGNATEQDLRDFFQGVDIEFISQLSCGSAIINCSN